MDKDSLIILVRIGVKGLDEKETSKNISSIKEIFKSYATQGNVTIFYLANFDTINTNIECINPKLVTQDTYKEAENKLKLLNDELDKLLKIQ